MARTNTLVKGMDESRVVLIGINHEQTMQCPVTEVQRGGKKNAGYRTIAIYTSMRIDVERTKLVCGGVGTEAVAVGSNDGAQGLQIEPATSRIVGPIRGQDVTAALSRRLVINRTQLLDNCSVGIG